MKVRVSASTARPGREWRALAEQTRARGFDRLVVADHLGAMDPFVAASVAAASGVRVGTNVVNTGLWNVLLLGRAAATAAACSDGRFVLGLGAGHASAEHRQAGIPYLEPAARVARFRTVVATLRALLDGATVTEPSLQLDAACVGIDTPGPVPLLVGGNGNAVLDIAGELADEVGLVGFRAGPEQRAGELSHWTWDGLEDRIRRVRRAAAGRGMPIDLLVQHVELTSNRDAAATAVAARAGGDAALHLDSPFLLLGTESEIAGQLTRLSALGVSSVTVFEQAADPVLPLLARDA